eukprot:1194901-Prorocentrum_minimum.AAC.3
MPSARQRATKDVDPKYISQTTCEVSRAKVPSSGILGRKLTSKQPSRVSQRWKAIPTWVKVPKCVYSWHPNIFMT